MKKFLPVLLTICLIPTVLLWGCDSNNNTSNSDESKKTSIVATIFPEYDFSREIAGDKADVTMLLSPGADTHSYEPTPQEIVMIQESDLFIYTGGESDVWLDNILESLDTEKIKILSLMDIVETVEEEIVSGMDTAEEDAHSDNHDSYSYDEHVWTAPENAIKITKAITDTLCEIDTENSAAYKENCESYISSLSELDSKFEDVVKNADRDTIVFGDRFPFRYFTDAYGLNYYAAFPGCSTQSEPSAATVIFLTETVKSEEIPVVFYIEMSNQKVADAIAADTGAKTLLLHSCQTVTREEFESGATYLSIMENNLENLKIALN